MWIKEFGGAFAYFARKFVTNFALFECFIIVYFFVDKIGFRGNLFHAFPTIPTMSRNDINSDSKMKFLFRDNLFREELSNIIIFINMSYYLKFS
jgi:hypothetical protein